MQLFLVRHADRSHIGPDGSPAGDPPLNTLGRRQAQALAGRLAGAGLTHLYSSSARRCLETAQAVCQAAGVRGVVAPWLQEWGWVWRDPPPAPAVIAARYPAFEPDPVFREGEWGIARVEQDAGDDILRAMGARAHAVVDWLFRLHPRSSEDRVCLCSHYGFGACGLMPALMAGDPDRGHGDLDLAALTEVSCRPARTVVVRSNCTRHLVGLMAAVCANPACGHIETVHWEDPRCRQCGQAMVLRCRTCKGFIMAPAGRACPDCGAPYVAGAGPAV